MNLKRQLGLDIMEEKYAYANDPVMGHTSEQKIPDKWVSTTCGYCSVGCGMFIGVKDGHAVSVRGNPNHPVNNGKLCPKGLSEHYTLEASNRAGYPLLRNKRGKLTRVMWDEALATMVEKFRSVQKKYGHEALGVVSTGQLVTEEFYTLGKLVQLGLGTKNFDGNTTLCMASAVSGYKRSFGSDGPPGTYEDLTKADVILLLGANIADNHPILCQYLESNPGGTLMVADPRVTKTAMMADLYLPLKPRSDIALINGMIHLLIENDLIDREYIAAHTTGFEALKESVRRYTPDSVSRLTGLTPEQIYKATLIYGKAKAPFIGWTMGVNHSTKGTETVNVINNLALITGNVGKPGASPFSITGQCNAMGTREAGFTSSLPGYRKFESATDREELAAFWGIDRERIPTSRGWAYPDIIEGAVSKKIRALWVIATNPVVSFPNLGVLQQSLDSLDFLVVQDGFHPTPTTEVADLVLPAAIWGEKEGTYTNSERRVSKVNRAVQPPGEARTDFDIFLDLAKRLGCYDELFPGWTQPRDAFEEWKRVSRGRLCDYSGLDYELIERHGGIQWPYPANTVEVKTTRLYSDGQFSTEDGKARLICVEWEPFPEQPNADFPFVLNTGRTVEHWHTRTKTGIVPILERLSPNAWLEMNPRDAQSLGLKPHERVDVISARGRVKSVELRVTEIIAPGQVFMPFHYAEANANQVTQSAFDPISREPNYKQCAVRIERALISPQYWGRAWEPKSQLRSRTGWNKFRRTQGDEMNKKKFMESGHFPTLIAAFLYFDVSFMVWVMLGPLAPFLSEMLKLTPYQKGLLTAIPLLGGALFRPVLGFLGERFGERRTGLFGLAFTLLPLILGWRFAHTAAQFYFLGLLLGIGGASFAVALPIAGRWYPPEYQGLVMGIAGAGNSGTLIATLFAPRLAQKFGWANTFALAMLPVMVVLVLFALLAKDSPRRSEPPKWKAIAAILREPDTAWFCFFYSLTFGGFVGMASFLTTFFHDQYGLSKVRAGDFTTIVVLAGSFLRPVGGWLSDKIGGYRLLLLLLAGVAGCLGGVGRLPALPLEVALLFLAMGMMGMGNGAVFQLLPQRFPERVGILTGLVGAAGGLGGFFLPFLLGAIKQRTGQYSGGLFLFAGAFLAAALILLQLGTKWRANWQEGSADRAGIFSYRSFSGAPMGETVE